MSKRIVRLRAAILAVGVTSSVAGLLAVLLPSLDLTSTQPFAVLLCQWCSLVLIGCALWAWVVTMLVLAEALHAPGGAPTLPQPPLRRGIPDGYRRLVLGACGLALTAGTTAPALATPGPVHLETHEVTSTTHTPPARAPIHAPSPSRPADRRVGSDIVVHPGDSLWQLSAERLPQDADDATIAHTWQRLYRANHRLIGDDPDHIEPGQRLARPEGW